MIIYLLIFLFTSNSILGLFVSLLFILHKFTPPIRFIRLNSKGMDSIFFFVGCLYLANAYNVHFQSLFLNTLRTNKALDGVAFESIDKSLFPLLCPWWWWRKKDVKWNKKIHKFISMISVSCVSVLKIEKVNK